MADGEEEQDEETIEDLFGKGETGDEGADADEAAESAAESGGESTGGEDAEAAVEGTSGAPEPEGEPTEAERNVGDQLDEAWDEGNAAAEADDAGTTEETPDVDRDVTDVDEADLEDDEGTSSEGEPPLDDEPGGEADDATDGEEVPPTEDEPSAAEGAMTTTNGGTASAGATASGIDEDLLDADNRAAPPQPGGGTERLTTGIEALDHHLGGGIPPGRIIAFVATADTQSELLVKQLASQHDCLYLSTLRPKWEVQEEVTDYIQKKGAANADQQVQIEQLTADSRLDAARREVESLDRQSVVVVDAANELESSETDRYAYFIDEVKRALWDTGSVGLFYCIEEEQPPPGRAVTLRRADVIWRLRQSEEVGGIRHELLISKFRGGRALIEPLTLWLTDEVVMEEG